MRLDPSIDKWAWKFRSHDPAEYLLPRDSRTKTRAKIWKVLRDRVRNKARALWYGSLELRGRVGGAATAAEPCDSLERALEEADQHAATFAEIYPKESVPTSSSLVLSLMATSLSCKAPWRFEIASEREIEELLMCKGVGTEMFEGKVINYVVDDDPLFPHHVLRGVVDRKM